MTVLDDAAAEREREEIQELDNDELVVVKDGSREEDEDNYVGDEFEVDGFEADDYEEDDEGYAEDEVPAGEQLLRQGGADAVSDYVLPEADASRTFINTTQLESGDIRRLIHLLIRRQKSIALYRIGIAAFGVFFIGYGILSYVRFLDDGNRANLMSGGLVALLGLGSLYLAVWGIIQMTTRRVMKSADRFLYKRRYRLTPEGLEYQPSGYAPLAVRWSEINEWTQDERNFYLLVGGSWFIIAKAGFRNDAAKQVEALIREQGIKTSKISFRRFS
ncbi:MAG: YcxB family protein [Bacillota bacterium]|nr:YcxB family protein [Bacillota bacterium]